MLTIIFTAVTVYIVLRTAGRVFPRPARLVAHAIGSALMGAWAATIWFGTGLFPDISWDAMAIGTGAATFVLCGFPSWLKGPVISLFSTATAFATPLWASRSELFASPTKTLPAPNLSDLPGLLSSIEPEVFCVSLIAGLLISTALELYVLAVGIGRREAQLPEIDSETQEEEEIEEEEEPELQEPEPKEDKPERSAEPFLTREGMRNLRARLSGGISQRTDYTKS